MSFIQGSPLGKDNASIDASGVLRTSRRQNLFESTIQYNDLPEFWDTNNIAGAICTFLPDESAVDLRITNAVGSSADRMTHSVIRYQPGRGQLAEMSFVFGAKSADTFREVGLFNDRNGIFLQQTPTDINVVLKSSTSGIAVDIVIPQSSWNLDTLDGNGPSGVVFNELSSQLLIIDFQWLSVGRVRYGFLIDGQILYFHEFDHSNGTCTTAYMTTANLHARYKIFNKVGGNLGGETLKQICVSVSSEGGQQPILSQGFPSSFSTQTIPITAILNIPTPIIAIRQGDTFNGIINETLSFIDNLNILGDKQTIFIQVIKNADLTGTIWGTNTTQTALELASSITYTPGGINEKIVMETHIQDKAILSLASLSSLREPLTKGPFAPAGGGDTLLILITDLTGANSTVHAGISLLEQR